MEFKSRLKELRLENDVSQSEIGALLNTSKMAASHWERGNGEPSIKQLKILASYFNVSVDCLIGYTD